MDTTPDTTKISINVYPALLVRFKRSLGQIIKRDAFLNQLLAQEIPVLRAELEGMKNSEAARRHIAREFRKLKPETINVVLEKTVAAELNQVVEEFNLVRDSFLNFLLYCLDPLPGFYRHFELPEYFTYSDFSVHAEPPKLSPMQTIADTLFDPFYYLRTAVSEKWSCGLYALDLPEKMHGLSCYLPDYVVPQTAAHRGQKRLSDLLMKELDELDAASFPASIEGEAS